MILIVCFGFVLSDEICKQEKGEYEFIILKNYLKIFLFYFSDEFKKLMDSLDDRDPYRTMLQTPEEYIFHSTFEYWMRMSYNKTHNDKTKKEYNEKMYKLFEKGYQMVKCNYHDELKSASESAEKFNKINDEQRKK